MKKMRLLLVVILSLMLFACVSVDDGFSDRSIKKGIEQTKNRSESTVTGNILVFVAGERSVGLAHSDIDRIELGINPTDESAHIIKGDECVSIPSANIQRCHTGEFGGTIQSTVICLIDDGAGYRREIHCDNSIFR